MSSPSLSAVRDDSCISSPGPRAGGSDLEKVVQPSAEACPFGRV